ncbi:MAG: cysteine desulfurase [Pseudomonadota bacterium]
MSDMAVAETVALHSSVVPGFNLPAIRADFPILAKRFHGKPLAFFDTAASAQKPRAVIEAVSGLYENDYANVHRGLYALSDASTRAYEAAREKVRAHINAASEREIVFTRGTTEAINAVAGSLGIDILQPGDEVIISTLEHHANIVPWQMLRDRHGIVLKIIPITDDVSLDLEAFHGLLSDKTKLVAVTHQSNAVGVRSPVVEIVAACRERGIATLVDGAQGIVHGQVDVQALGCDFYVFSGHKFYGPTGIGVLYGREEWLDRMTPWQGGGEMIRTVTFDETTYADLPAKFEAGTPPIAQAVGLGAAIDYVTSVGFEKIAAHERDVYDYARDALSDVDGVSVVGNTPDQSGALSFTMACAHPHDIGTVIDREGVAVRAGHHCAMPLLQRLDLPATTRASFGLYNSRADVDALVASLKKVLKLFA